MSDQEDKPREKEQNSKEEFSVDREKTTPFLIRVFVHKRRHFEDKEFKDPLCLPKMCQIHIHTWIDATLFELSNLLTKAVPDYDASRPSDFEISFALVYPDRKGKMVVKKCGKLSPNGKNEDAKKTLKDLKFEIGDFLDVAITSLNNNDNDNGYVHPERNGNLPSNSSYNNGYRRSGGGHSSYSSYRGGRGGHFRNSYRGGRGRGRGRGRGGYRGRGRGSYGGGGGRNRRY